MGEAVSVGNNQFANTQVEPNCAYYNGSGADYLDVGSAGRDVSPLILWAVTMIR